MIYDKQILQILIAVGDRGISVSSLSKHIYNLNTSFFNSVELEDIHKYVQQYLLRNSKQPQSIFEPTERRGYYRLNTQYSDDARQLVLQFAAHEDDVTENNSTPADDLSLSLF